mmetsp:Transcript_11178/g.29807  ORF Transcript_11178/g.29807 Transcript_11178/m.29807 type:complete len:214 (+) Transcript_11178:325-966(+)
MEHMHTPKKRHSARWQEKCPTAERQRSLEDLQRPPIENTCKIQYNGTSEKLGGMSTAGMSSSSRSCLKTTLGIRSPTSSLRSPDASSSHPATSVWGTPLPRMVSTAACAWAKVRSPLRERFILSKRMSSSLCSFAPAKVVTAAANSWKSTAPELSRSAALATSSAPPRLSPSTSARLLESSPMGTPPLKSTSICLNFSLALLSCFTGRYAARW